jgi:hypothetical protein
MPLEQAIQENTAALHSLLAFLQSGSAPTLAIRDGGEVIQPQAAVGENTASDTAEASPAKPEVAAKKTAKSSATAERDEQPATEPAGVTYDQAAKAIQELAKAKGRDAAIEVLKQFGAAKLPEVKESDFAAVVAACGAA